MGLMRALQGVATGYLSGEVDRMAAIKKHKLFTLYNIYEFFC